MGIRPFYYQLNNGRFFFAVSMDCFRHLSGCDMTPSMQWMADFMTGLSMSWTETPFPHIRKLPPRPYPDRGGGSTRTAALAPVRRRTDPFLHKQRPGRGCLQGGTGPGCAESFQQ
ncbi:MAG: hypothetical protein D3909_18650 [Candidatus Electrothrix sp. ATG1]|nr:hypothetical protein [Candidatus Electrothrix sp. ATG1]